VSIEGNKELCDICLREIERKEGESSVISFRDNISLHYHKTCHDNAETLSYGFIKRFFWDLCWQLNHDKKELTTDNLMWYSNNEVTTPHSRKKDSE